MSKFIYLIIWALTGAAAVAQVTVEQPQIRHASAIAIVIDSDTYTHTKQEVTSYRQMLENKEGLSAYVVSANWESPEQVQTVIRKLAGQTPALEGMVLIGKVPVVMVRNAQHMASAFKMDEEKFPLGESSIASDRFYDDFDLTFRFVKRDSQNPLLFYYELNESSLQIVQSEIYTSRILSHATGEKQYSEISSFLKKAVAARNESNSLDKMLAFAGSGYVSESLTAWMDDRMAYKELFPKAFTNPANNHLLNHRMQNNIKFTLFSELQRPGLDFAILSSHGDVDRQYINGSEASSGFRSNYENMKYSLRKAVRETVEDGGKPDDVMRRYTNNYGIPAAWFAGATDNDSLRHADSLRQANADIVTAEIAGVAPQAKVILLDACYNGSFHKPDNIAGSYLFNSEGHALAVHGNSVSVLQDKYLLTHTGLLDAGARIGHWHRLAGSLESNLIGDPTYHFAASPNQQDLNSLLIPGKTSTTKWLQLLKVKNPAMQSLALSSLYDVGYEEINDVLLNAFLSSPFHTVRMQCLQLLSQTGTEQYKTVLEAGLHDEYEMIRRKSASYMGHAGDERFISKLVETAISHPNDDRVLFNIDMALGVMDWEKIEAAIREQMQADQHFFNKEEKLNAWLSKIEGNKEMAHSFFDKVKDKEAKTERRIQSVKIFRNYNYHAFVGGLLTIAEDGSESAELRKAILEALGWFSTSFRKKEITEACNRMIDSEDNPGGVVAEATQTLKRLEKWKLP